MRELLQSGREAERRLGVSAAQLFVLEQLREGTPLSINELAARTLTHQSSVSVVVSRLVEKDLVTREASTSDRRRMQVALTARGQALLRRAPHAVQWRMLDFLKNASPSMRRSLGEGLSSLAAAIGTATGPAPMLLEEPEKKRRTSARRS